MDSLSSQQRLHKQEPKRYPAMAALDLESSVHGASSAVTAGAMGAQQPAATMHPSDPSPIGLLSLDQALQVPELLHHMPAADTPRAAAYATIAVAAAREAGTGAGAGSRAMGEVGAAGDSLKSQASGKLISSLSLCKGASTCSADVGVLTRLVMSQTGTSSRQSAGALGSGLDAVSYHGDVNNAGGSSSADGCSHNQASGRGGGEAHQPQPLQQVLPLDALLGASYGVYGAAASPCNQSFAPAPSAGVPGLPQGLRPVPESSALSCSDGLLDPATVGSLEQQQQAAEGASTAVSGNRTAGSGIPAAALRALPRLPAKVDASAAAAACAGSSGSSAPAGPASRAAMSACLGPWASARDSSSGRSSGRHGRGAQARYDAHHLTSGLGCSLPTSPSCMQVSRLQTSWVGACRPVWVNDKWLGCAAATDDGWPQTCPFL